MSLASAKEYLTLSWLETTFAGTDVQWYEPIERIIRAMEEINELGQVVGATREQAHALVDQVYDKPVGELNQELGGVMVTLAAFAGLMKLSLDDAWREEYDRVNTVAMMAKIVAKQKDKLVRHNVTRVDGPMEAIEPAPRPEEKLTFE